MPLKSLETIVYSSMYIALTSKVLLSSLLLVRDLVLERPTTRSLIRAGPLADMSLVRTEHQAPHASQC